MLKPCLCHQLIILFDLFCYLILFLQLIFLYYILENIHVQSNISTILIVDFIEEYLKRSQTSTMELFCKNNQQLSAVNYFCEKVPSQIFDWVLNTLLLCVQYQQQNLVFVKYHVPNKELLSITYVMNYAKADVQLCPIFIAFLSFYENCSKYVSKWQHLNFG